MFLKVCFVELLAIAGSFFCGGRINNSYNNCAEDPSFACFDPALPDSGLESFLHDDLPNCFEPIDNLSSVNITFDGCISISSYQAMGWDLFVFNEKVEAKLASSDISTNFSIIFADSNGRNLSYNVFFHLDCFNRHFYSKISQYKAAEFANEYMYNHSEISSKTYIYNLNRINESNYSLVQSASNINNFVDLDSNGIGVLQDRGTVYTYNGILSLADCDGTLLICKNLYLEFWAYNGDTSSWDFINSTYTSSDGSFTFYIGRVTNYTYISFFAFAKDGFNNRFVDSTNSVYWERFFYYPLYQNSFYGVGFTINYSAVHCQELIALECITHSTMYAKYLNNGVAFSPVIIKYISGVKTYYQNGIINIGANGVGTINGIKVTENWDILSHEYGHHVQFSSGFYGTYLHSWPSLNHAVHQSDCDNLHISVPDVPLEKCRHDGLVMSWRESWPTFFGNCMQNYFCSVLQDVSTCCNNTYEYSTGEIDYYDGLANQIVEPTDSCEAIIISFLYELNDINNSQPYDYLSLSDIYIFTLCKNEVIKTFNEFYVALVNDGINHDYLSRLLVYCGLSPNASNIIFSSFDEDYVIVSTYSDRHVNFNFDSVEFYFYDVNYNEFLCLQGTNIYNLYSITTSPQDTILFDSYVSSIFYLRIKVLYAITDPNDYYLSPFFIINKLTGAVNL